MNYDGGSAGTRARVVVLEAEAGAGMSGVAEFAW